MSSFNVICQRVDSFLRDKTCHKLIILAGIFFRLTQYFYNRSLWFDEAYVANKLIKFSLSELIQGPFPEKSLAYPFGFSFIEKIMVVLFGSHEYVFRFFPLFYGVISLILFYALIIHVLSPRARFVALCLFAFSPSLILYSTELKPYSGDVAFVLMFMVAIKWFLDNKLTKRSVSFVSLLGGILIWFSHPIIFVLAGAGIVLSIIKIKERKEPLWRPLAFVLFSWMSSFALNYFFVLRVFSRGEYLTDYWAKFFLPVFPVKLVNLIFHYTIFLDVFRYPVSAKFPFLCSILFLAGCVKMFYRERRDFFLLISPIVITLLASVLHIYPFFERLILFLVPFYILFVAEGADGVIERIKYKNICPLLMLLFVLPAFFTECSRVGDPSFYRYEESREVVRYMVEHKQAGDYFILPDKSQAAFRFYSGRMNFVPSASGIKVLSCTHELQSVIKSVSGRDRFWLFLAHVGKKDKEFMLEMMHHHAELVDSFFQSGARAYLFQIEPDP